MSNFSVAVRNEGLNARTARCNNGTIKIYAGTKPANADTAITTQTLLVTLNFAATAFGAASGGVATANAITGNKAVAAGTASWARIYQSDGTTVVGDITVDTAAADMLVDTTQFVVNATITCDSLTLSEPA